MSALGAPARIEAAVVQGDDLAIAGQAGDADAGYDLTGWTIASQVRKYADSATLLGSFAVTLGDQTADPGSFSLSMGHAVTRDLPVGRLAWDIQSTAPDGSVSTWASGVLVVLGDVTRSA